MLGQSSLRPHTCGSNSRAAGGVQQRFVVTRAKKQGSRPGFSTGPTQPRNPNLYNLPPIDPSAPGGSPPQPPQQQQGATTTAPPYGQPMQGAPQGPPAAVPLTVPPGQQQQQQQQRRPQGAPNGQPGWAQPAVQNPAQPGFITQPGFTTQQPGFNTQQQPGFNTQQQPGFNTQQQPGFTTQQPKQQAGFTTQQPQQTQQPMQQPGFTTQPPKQQPGFNIQQQPGFINQQQPGFINQQPMQQQGYTNQQQPGFINQQQPGFNNQQQPGFMNQQQPGFGNAPGTQPGFTTAPGAPQGSGFQQPLDPALSNFAQPGFQQQPGQQNGGYINTNQQNGGFVQQPGLQNGGYMNTNPNGGYINTNQQNGGYMTGQQNGGYMMPNTDRWQQGGQQQGYPRQQQQQQQSWADLGSDQGGYINDQGGFIDAGRGNQGNTGGYITQRGGWGQQGGQRNNRNQQQQQPQMFLNEGGYMNDMPNRSWGNPQRNNKPGFAGFDNTNTWTEDFLLKTLEGQLRPNQQYQLQEWVEEVEQEEDLTPKYVNGKRVLVNSEIDASQVRVQDANKADVGVMAFEAAREMSISQDMDVVMITEDADPPVVRIIAFSKYKYEMEKTAKQKQKASKGPEIKEVKLRPVTEKADYDTKVKQAQKFLSKGAKVKLTMTFSGREMRFKDQGKEMMLKLIEELSTDSKMEAPLALRPSNFSVTLVPLK